MAWPLSEFFISWMVGIFLAFMTVIGSLNFGLRAWLPHTAQ